MSIRQDLELDIQAALAEVANLESALTASLASAAETLAASIAAAVSELPDLVPTITPEVDTSAAVAAVIGDVEAASPVVDVTTTTDIDTLTAEVFNALEAVTPVIVPVAEAQGIVDQVSAALGDAIDVPIDTGPVSDALASAVEQGVADGLTNATASSDAAGAIGDQATQIGSKLSAAFGQGGAAVQAFDAAVAGASGSLGQAAQKMPGLAVGGSIFASVGLAAKGLFDQAEEVRAAEERLNIVFGDQAAAVQKVDVGGLKGDLGELAIQAGSSDEALREAVANFGQFGQGAGASQEQIGEAANALSGLTLRAVAMRPSLGDAGAAMDRLSGALITGRAKALAPFGISLDQVAVKAKAQEIALADGRDEVTKFDLVTAGAALASQQLGDSMGTDFEKGTQQFTVRLASLRQQVGEFAEAAGGPLLDPLMAGAQAAVPLVGSLATAIGSILAAVVPVAVGIGTALAPALTSAAEAVTRVVEAARPAVEVLGTALSAPVRVAATAVKFLADVLQLIPAPVITTVAAFLAFRQSALVLVPQIASLATKVGTGLKAAFTAGAEGPVTLAAGFKNASTAVKGSVGDYVGASAAVKKLGADTAGAAAEVEGAGAAIAAGGGEAATGLGGAGLAADTSAAQIIGAAGTIEEAGLLIGGTAADYEALALAAETSAAQVAAANDLMALSGSAFVEGAITDLGVVAADYEALAVSAGVAGEAGVVAGAEIAAGGEAAGIGLSAALGPVGILVGVLGAAAVAFGLFSSDSQAAKIDAEALADALTTVTHAAGETGPAVIDVGENFKNALKDEKLGEFGKSLTDNSNELLSALSDVGVGAADLGRLLQSGSKGAREFDAALLSTEDKSGELAVALAKTGRSFQAINDQADASPEISLYVDELARASGISLDAAEKLIRVAHSQAEVDKQFREAQKSAQDGAKAQLALLASDDKLTESQKAKIKAIHEGNGAGESYISLLDKVKIHLDDLTARQEASAAATANAAVPWGQLASTVLSSTGDMTEALHAFADANNLTDDQVKAVADQVSASLDQIVSDAQSTLPTAGTAIKQWSDDAATAFGNFSKAAADSKTSRKDLIASKKAFEDATNPGLIIQHINEQAQAVRDFSSNVAKLFASGNERAAQEALKLGPEAGAAYAKSLVEGGPQIEAGVNTALLGADKANADYLDRVQTQWGPQLVGAMGQIGVDASGAVTFGLSDPSQSQAVLQQNLDTVLSTFGAKSPQFAEAARLLGVSVSDALKLQLGNVPADTTAQLGVAVSLIQSYVPVASTNAAAVAAAISSTYVGGLQNLTPETAAAMTFMATAILAAQPGLSAASAATALNMATQFGNAITGGEGIPAKGSNAYKQLEGDIRGQIPGLSVAAADAAIAQAKAFEDHQADIPKAADLGLNAMTGHLRDSTTTLSTAGHTAGKAVSDGVTSGIAAGTPAATGAATTSGTQVGTAYSTGAAGGIQGNRAAVGTAANSVVEAIGGGSLMAVQSASSGREIGEAFDSGMAAGIAANSAAVAAAATAAVNRAAAAARAAGEVKSPSRVFARIGTHLTEGLATGMQAGAGLAAAAAKRVVKTIAETVTADAERAAKAAEAKAKALEEKAAHTGTEADQKKAQEGREAATKARQDAEIAFRAAETASGKVQQAAAKMMEGTAKAVHDQLDKSIASASTTANRAVDSSAAAIVKALGSGVTQLGAGARAGLTTGAISLADVVGPVGEAIDSILAREHETVTGAIEKIGVQTGAALDQATAKSTHALDVLVNGKDAAKVSAAKTVTAQPKAVTTVTPTPSFAQAVAGAVSTVPPVTVSLSIGTINGVTAANVDAIAKRLGQVAGNAAADTLARRGVEAEVRVG